MNDRMIGDPIGTGARYLAFRGEIDRICRACGRDPAEVVLVAVSKNADAAAAAEAVRAGAQDLGENRVQELLSKQAALSGEGLSPRWHLIGTLQTNKVRQVAGRTELIHSVDRLDLAQEIDRRSQAMGIATSILLQVNIAHEASKHGFDPAETARSLAEMARMPGLRVEGLMTMAPLDGGMAAAEDTFGAARGLFDRLRAAGDADPAVFRLLSMGMSGDYEAAIRAGATHVRVGGAIFGPKNVT